MAASYRQINYSLRPAKAIERKMLCEAFQRLYPFAKIETYRYVGFGSIYFSDFYLFHNALGMDDMVSIEKDAHAQKCFEFNRPYSCVRLDFGLASEVLPELDWQAKTIIWLDYDGKLNEMVLSDVTSVCARASSGTMLLVSVNAQADGEPDEEKRQKYREETGKPFDIHCYRLREFNNRVEEDLPPEVTGRELRGEQIAKISRKLIDNKIAESLASRNGPLPDAEKLMYRQIFNFHYRDGARMLTVGGIFFETDEESKFNACSFDELPFVCSGEEAYTIKVPCLTLKEMRHLNAQLPEREGTSLDIPDVPPEDVEAYAKLYRYFPTFAEAIFT